MNGDLNQKPAAPPAAPKPQAPIAPPVPILSPATVPHFRQAPAAPKLAPPAAPRPLAPAAPPVPVVPKPEPQPEDGVAETGASEDGVTDRAEAPVEEESPVSTGGGGVSVFVPGFSTNGAPADDGEIDPRVPLPDDSVLEDYTIIRKLGQGGFGITYLARHTEKGTVVVIKEHMPKGLAAREPGGRYVMSVSPEKEEDFRHTMVEFNEEVTVLLGLEHPGIVPILSAFEANGTAYYVMPYVEGKTLDISLKPTMDIVERRRDARIIRQQLTTLLDTLEYLAQHQVVHRDIKPENIVLCTDGRLIMLDFGSARQIRPGKVFSNIYTPDFAAPEQTLAKNDVEMSAKLGPWTDIYALGATFHYLITRMMPPRSDMRGHAEMDPYKPLAKRADLCKLYGVVFLKAIDRALEMRPKNRWHNAADWRQGIMTGMLPTSPREMRRARWVMAASVLLVGIFGGICLWAIRERNQAVQMYNSSLQFSEGILYDFNEELSDVPGATKLQAQLVTQLKNFLDEVDSLSLGTDEKLQRALSSAWRNLGYIYLEQGKLEAATEALLRATDLQAALVEAHPDNQAYRFNLARIWLSRAEVARRRNLTPTAAQFVAQAAEVLRELCKLSPGNPEYKCALGKAMDLTGSLARLSGNVELYKRSIQEQLALYGDMAAVYPRNTAIKTGMGYALLSDGQLSMDGGSYDAALSRFEEGKQIFADLSQSNPYRLSFKKGLASVYHSMGLLHSRMGEQKGKNGRKGMDNAALADYENQLRLAHELADLDPENAEYVYMQCRTMSLIVDILLRTRRVNQAEAYCNTILQKIETLLATAPDNVDYAMLKAGALRGLATAHADSNYGTGQASQEFQESRSIMERMLSQTPGNLSMRYMYVEVLESSARNAITQGDKAQARRWLSQAIDLMERMVKDYPDSQMAHTRLKSLRKLMEEVSDVAVEEPAE